ncbi:hypothetical protein [Streptomyces sp. NPDC002845]
MRSKPPTTRTRTRTRSSVLIASLTALISAAALFGVLAPQATAVPPPLPPLPPLPLPIAAGPLATEGLTVEGPLINNLVLPTL